MSKSSHVQTRPWSQYDVSALRTLSERGVSNKLIALLLSRPVQSVSAKRRALNLSPAPDTDSTPALFEDAWLPVEMDILRKVVQVHRADSNRPLHRRKVESVAQDLRRPLPLVLSALRALGFSDYIPASVLDLLPTRSPHTRPGVSTSSTHAPAVPDQQTPEPEQQIPAPEPSLPTRQGTVPRPFIPPASEKPSHPLAPDSDNYPVRVGETSGFERLFPSSQTQEVTITSPITGISTIRTFHTTQPVSSQSKPDVSPVVSSAVRSLISSGVSTEVVAQATGISTADVDTLVHTYNLTPAEGVNTEPWSAFEVAYLEDQLSGVSSVEFSTVVSLASGLNREVSSVSKKIQQLGISVPEVSNVLKDSDYALLVDYLEMGWIPKNCARFLNVTEEVIQKAILECTVPARVVPWSEEEVSTLKGIFGNATHYELTSALPLRPLPAILSKAESLNL